MTATTSATPFGQEAVVRRTASSTAPDPRPIPLSRVVKVELRKSFDTRAGAWLLRGIGLAALATTGALLAWAPEEQLAYGQFVLAIGMPMTVILPIVAVLSVTSEWSQRTGLATFTLVPHRGRVLLAKALSCALVALASTAVAFTVAVGGNLVAARTGGITAVWDVDAASMVAFACAITLLMLVGFTLGALIRTSAGAVVAYMVYAFVLPGLLALLAMNQAWFRELRPWVDAKLSQDALLQGGLSGDQWAHLAVTSLEWLVLPLVVAVVAVLRAEVK